MGFWGIHGPTGAHLPVLKLLELQSLLITRQWGSELGSRRDFPCSALGVAFLGWVILHAGHLSGQVTFESGGAGEGAH